MWIVTGVLRKALAIKEFFFIYIKKVTFPKSYLLNIVLLQYAGVKNSAM